VNWPGFPQSESPASTSSTSCRATWAWGDGTLHEHPHSPYLRLILSDSDATRIEFELRRADRETLTRWLKELLDDRRARSALLQGQARRLAHLRQRLKQATDYLDGLALKAQEEVQAPWPGNCSALIAARRLPRSEAS
jgi:hypothetical protein